VVSDPAGNGLADWKHLTLFYLCIHMDATYRELVDWASEMDRVRALLQLSRWEFPAPSTLWRSFERVPTRVWRQLLARAAARCDPGEHGAVDATFFDREAASSHYRRRSDRDIHTLKTTALVDTETCAILDIHISAHWPHDTQVGRRVALRNTDEIASLAGDKGRDDQSLWNALRSEGVRPLIKPGCSSTTTRSTTRGWTMKPTGNSGWPKPPFRPSSADTAPLSGRASGTASSANWC